MDMATCPVCRKPAAARALNPAFPFCSERCKLVDLGAWASESYRVPAEDPPDDDDEPPREPS